MKAFNEKAAHNGETLKSLGDFLLHPVQEWSQVQLLQYLFLLSPDQMAADVSAIPEKTREQVGDELICMVAQVGQAAQRHPDDLEQQKLVSELMGMLIETGLQVLKGKTL